MAPDADLLGPNGPRFLRAREVAVLLRTTEGALAKRRHRGDPGPPWIRDVGTILYPAVGLRGYLALPDDDWVVC